MFSSVLRRDQAIQTNIAIMRMFFELRHFLGRNTDLADVIQSRERESNHRFKIPINIDHARCGQQVPDGMPMQRNRVETKLPVHIEHVEDESEREAAHGLYEKWPRFYRLARSSVEENYLAERDRDHDDKNGAAVAVEKRQGADRDRRGENPLGEENRAGSPFLLRHRGGPEENHEDPAVIAELGDLEVGRVIENTREARENKKQCELGERAET